jgi:hypothetical protein
MPTRKNDIFPRKLASVGRFVTKNAPVVSDESVARSRLRRTNPGGGGRTTTKLRLSALGLRRDPHGYVKQMHHEELEDGEKERPSAFPKIMLKQTDSRIQ